MTGGSRGLGREMVRGLAGAGADVVIASRKARRALSWQRRCRPRQGEPSRYRLPRRQVGRGRCLGRGRVPRFGRLDVLVNNAGMSPVYPDPESVTEELYDKVFAVNLKGPFRLMALAGSKMNEGDGGSIINISATSTTRPNARVLPYAAAKAGVETLTIGFAQALGPKVRVNCIVCGPFLTDVSKSWDPDETAKRTSRYAMGRPGRPEESWRRALLLRQRRIELHDRGAAQGRWWAAMSRVHTGGRVNNDLGF